MQGYLLGLLVLSLLCALIEWLAPAGEGEGMRRSVRYLCVLALLVVMLAPLSTLLQEGVSLPDRWQSALDEWLSSREEAEEDYADRWQTESERLDTALAEQAIAQMLAERFAVEATDLSVTVTPGDSQTPLCSVRVALSGRAIWLNTHEMEEFILTTFGCECIIYIE